MRTFNASQVRWTCDPHLDYGMQVGIGAEYRAKNGRWFRQGARLPTRVARATMLVEAGTMLLREVRLSVQHPLYHRALKLKRRVMRWALEQ